MTVHETRLWHEIGLDCLMPGVDLPHFGTTTPNTTLGLHATCGADRRDT